MKNLSDTEEKELKISKQLLCDCSLIKDRLQRKGKRVICPHKDIVEIRPAIVKINPNDSQELEMTFRYELLGQQEVHLTIVCVVLNWSFA